MRPKPLRVYLDASVIGGAYDKAFAKDTKPLLEAIATGGIVPVVSELVRIELKLAPEAVKRLLREIETLGAELLDISPEAVELANAYIAAGVVTANFREDALHIAIASLAKVDVLVSWNYKHIVNFQRIRGFNGVNLLRGYQVLDIRTPKEVVSGEA